MSRGPGVLQRRVLETLAEFQIHPPRRPCWFTEAAWADYCKRVPVLTLVRMLRCSRCDLSRALKSLDARNLIVRYNAYRLAFGPRDHEWCNCKYVELTGTYWLKRQQKLTGESWHLAPTPESRVPQ